MRFMIIRRADALTESGAVPDPGIFEKMDAYMGEMHKAGILIAGDGLKPSAQGARVNFHGGKPTVVDGPFTETKELIAGYSIIDVPSLADAIAWAKRWPAVSTEANVSLEIRPFFETSDFEDVMSPEAREHEEQMRRELEERARQAGR